MSTINFNDLEAAYKQYEEARELWERSSDPTSLYEFIRSRKVYEALEKQYEEQYERDTAYIDDELLEEYYANLL